MAAPAAASAAGGAIAAAAAAAHAAPAPGLAQLLGQIPFLADDTPVRMADARLKPARELVAGDRVTGQDGAALHVAAVHHHPGVHGMVEIQGRIQTENQGGVSGSRPYAFGLVASSRTDVLLGLNTTSAKAGKYARVHWGGNLDRWVPASRVGTINHAGNNSNACAPRLPPLCSPGVPLHLATFPIPTTLMLEDGTPVTSLTAAYQRAMEVHNRPLPNLAHRPAGFRERTLAALVALHVTDGSYRAALIAVCDEPTDPAKVAEREFVVELLEDAAELFGLTVVVEEQCTAPGGGDAHAQRIALSTNDGGSAASYANQDGAPQMFVAATNAPAQKDRRDANPAYRFLRLLCLTDGARRILPDDSAAFLLNHTRELREWMLLVMIVADGNAVLNRLYYELKQCARSRRRTFDHTNIAKFAAELARSCGSSGGMHFSYRTSVGPGPRQEELCATVRGGSATRIQPAPHHPALLPTPPVWGAPAVCLNSSALFGCCLGHYLSQGAGQPAARQERNRLPLCGSRKPRKTN